MFKSCRPDEMTQEEEVQSLMQFLSHPAGFDVDLAGLLCIRPVDENSPPTSWEVDFDYNAWKIEEGCKVFDSLEDAARFFVQKRFEMQLGLDFEVEMWKNKQE